MIVCKRSMNTFLNRVIQQVCLNIEAFKDAHLVFLCRHRSSNEAKDRAEKPFALSYLRLMQREGTTTPDTQHNMCVYKVR